MNDLSKEAIQRVNILGVKVQKICLDTIIEYIVLLGSGRDRAIIAYANVQAINLAWKHPWFRDFLNESDLLFCDGFGASWAARFLYGASLHRHTPPDWIPQLAQACARNGLSMYLLGARPGVVEQAAKVLKSAAPGLIIAGMNHGYFDKSDNSPEQQALIHEINTCKPGVLVIGFGMPAQERWIMENRDRLDVGVFFPVGAMFDYIAKVTPRASRWITNHGLEWLARLVIEPGRLWKRYLLGNPTFIWRVVLQKLKLIQVGE